MSYIDRVADSIRIQLPDEVIPDGDTRDLFLNYAILALALGERVSTVDVHNAWAAWMVMIDPNHESLVPFEKLDEETQAGDIPFVEAIKAAVSHMQHSRHPVDETLLADVTSLRTEDGRKEYFELYKMMVGTSESLVSRRQTVNTYFITVNGLLVTGAGLLVKAGGPVRLQAIGVGVFSVVGALLSLVWRQVLVSFGQLNTGKFAVINRMERHLPAAIFAAEWEALGRGENPKIYRSFTKREALVPVAFAILFGIAVLCAAFVASRYE